MSSSPPVSTLVDSSTRPTSRATTPEPPPKIQMDKDARSKRLQDLLRRSQLYTARLQERFEIQKQESNKARTEMTNPNSKHARPDDDTTSRASKRVKHADNTYDGAHLDQPKLVTGATLKDYQLEGVSWLDSLYQNGLNGVLADEMGLGKVPQTRFPHAPPFLDFTAQTLQAIAFIAMLIEKKATDEKPILIVCPLSVLHNWVAEFEKFAPSIPVCMYYGTREERTELRRTRLIPPVAKEDDKPTAEVEEPSSSSKGKRRRKSSNQGSNKKPRANVMRRSSRKVSRSEEADEAEDTPDERKEPGLSLEERLKTLFPVVITTYEIIMRDHASLGSDRYKWGFIIVDEGHRLKNMNCKLIQQIKKYESANRLILTGTPLQNNLAELWSLLNFILPDLFTDLDSFQDWFNFGDVDEDLNISQSSEVVKKLHDILSPFLLRRLKSDVATGLPPKKEYVLYAPLSEAQRNLYNAVLDGGLRQLLIDSKHKALKRSVPAQIELPQDVPGPRARRAKKSITYRVDSDDDEDMADLGANRTTSLQDELQDMRKSLQKTATGMVNRLHLQNTTMQLRKACSHPFLFDWPTDVETGELVIDDRVALASGKMLLLERLLMELFKRGHKVLLFSQFTTMLDIIEDWAVEFKGWNICRIDGATSPVERREQMDLFNNPEGNRQLFLLSTRSGGLGINLVGADTVIFYDQDWNPQMDLQAQDRAHRIGQTKPVLVFRLVTDHTIETKIMQQATAKRKLEALVIAKGKFKKVGAKSETTAADLAASLLKLDEDQISVVQKGDQVISDDVLDMLLDRSPEVFTERRKGWKSDAIGNKMATSKNAVGAFEVFEATANEGNDVLARMFGEDVE